MSRVTGSCHCGAVRFEVDAPEWVMDCNCSHCRLYGGLWAYYPQREVVFFAIGFETTAPANAMAVRLASLRFSRSFHCAAFNTSGALLPVPQHR